LKLSLWIARRQCPFSIVDDDDFIELLKMLYDKVAIPGRMSVARDMQEIFKATRTKLGVMLKVLHQTESFD
jgi:hypothetical protein